MLILGIDPGSRKTGYALLKCQGKKIQHVASGVFCFDKITDFNQRLSEIYSKIKELIKKHQPDEITIESLIFVKSPTALIKLAQARGAILAACSETHSKKIFEYSPNLIKSSTTGHGHATKEGIQKSIEMIVGKRDFITDDESDACAAAICHIVNRDFLLKINDNKEKFFLKKSKKSMKKALNHMI